jgi:hypothetical protein
MMHVDIQYLKSSEVPTDLKADLLLANALEHRPIFRKRTSVSLDNLRRQPYLNVQSNHCIPLI